MTSPSEIAKVFVIRFTKKLKLKPNLNSLVHNGGEIDLERHGLQVIQGHKHHKN